MAGKTYGVIGSLAMFLVVSSPALADLQFKAARMTRGDVPLGKGQCDIRLRVDGEVEVSVRGDMVNIRTVSGKEARNDGSECNEPLPIREASGFRFEVLDRRNDIVLLSDPDRRNSYRAVVRIRDSDGGDGRYHFRLTWQMDGGGTGSGGQGGYGNPGGYPGSRPNQGWDGRGNGGLGAAIDACQDAVSARIRNQYGFPDVSITRAAADNNPGRNDYIIGEAVGLRGRNNRASFNFVCRVDLYNAQVRTVDVRRR